MKFTGIVFTVIYLQASASFLDNFRTAISDVERGFEKLLTDVVTDVKDTIHCTISAVEQVLVLNRLIDKTSTYNYKCRDMRKQIVPTNITPSTKHEQRSLYDHFNKEYNIYIKNFNRIQYPNRILDHRQSPRHISMELGKSIANVNKTINKILSHPEENSNLKIVTNTMKNETNRLAEISEILKQELENISSNIRLEIKRLNFDHHKVNVESVWEQFKTLYDVQQGSKNRSEVNEIRKVLDEVVDRLHLNSDNTKVLENYNLKEIRKKIQNYNDSDDKHIEEDSDARLRTRDLSLHKSETETSPKTFQDFAKKIINHKNVNEDQTTTRKSLFDSELDSFNYLTPFSNTNANDKKITSNAKKIIEDSQHTDKILNNFFNEHHSDTNVFSDLDLFNFGYS